MGWLWWWLYWRRKAGQLNDEVADILRRDAALPVRPWRCKFCQYRVLGGPDHNPSCRLYVSWH